MSRRRDRDRWWNKRITLTWWGEIAIALACSWLIMTVFSAVLPR